MSEIHANIVVQPFDITVALDQPGITVTPEALNLNVYAGGFAQAAGNNGTIQYNNGGVLGGINSVFWTGTQLSLGDTTNFTISGGSPNYALRTDGAGNLSWGDTANANYANFAGNAVYANNAGNANIANIANVAYSVSAANISGTVANANYAAYAGNITIAAQPNITSLGNLTSLRVVGNSNLGNIGNVKITGGVNGYYIQTDGTGNLFWVAGGGTGNGVVGGSNTQVQFNDGGLFGGTSAFTFDKTSNALGISGNLTAGNVSATNVSGTLVSSAVTGMPYGTEVVGIIGAQTGTYNFDLITNSIQYSNANAAANLTLNFRGNSTTTLSSILSTGQSITGTYLMTTGSTGYGVTAVQVDGAAQTIKWAGNISTVYSNTISSYTFTVVKTSATPTYLVFGSVTKYG